MGRQTQRLEWWVSKPRNTKDGWDRFFLSLHKEPALMTPQFQTFGLLNCEGIHFRCFQPLSFQHLVIGALGSSVGGKTNTVCYETRSPNFESTEIISLYPDLPLNSASPNENTSRDVVTVVGTLRLHLELMSPRGAGFLHVSGSFGPPVLC